MVIVRIGTDDDQVLAGDPGIHHVVVSVSGGSQVGHSADPMGSLVADVQPVVQSGREIKS